MPAVVPAIVSTLTFGGAVGLGVGIAIHATAFTVLTAWQRKQLSRDQGRIAMPPRDAMLRSTVEHRRIVYGECAVSGMLFWANSISVGGTTHDLYLAVVHAGHQIDEFLGYYVDDSLILAADINVFPGDDGEVVADTNDHGYAPVSGTSVMWLRGHLGEDSQTADSFLTSTFAEWTSDHRARGNAYTLGRFRQVDDVTEEVWAGVPATLQARVRGKLVYDPRLDSTQPGGSGSHRVNTPSTWEYSNNNVLCTRDYMVDAKLGMGKRCDYTMFDYAHIAEQADICDASVDVPGGTQARYSCNGVLSCGSSHEENLTALYASMNGRPAFKNGKHYIYAGAWETPIATLTERHLAGDLDFRKAPDSDDRFNQVRGVYFDAERMDKQVEFLPVNDTAIRSSRDNGKVIPRDLNLQLVNDEFLAQRLGFKLLYQDDDTGLCTILCNMAALQFEIGDPIALTIERLQWVAKPFRIVDMEIPANDRIKMVLREYNETSFDDPEDSDYGERTAAGIVSFPRDLPPKIRTPFIAPNATEVLVSSQPTDSTETIPAISYSGGGTMVDYSPITDVSWENDTGDSVDVVLRQTAKVALSASDSLIGRKLAMRWSLNGGSSWSYDGTTADNANIVGVSPDFQPRATQRTVTVAAGETIDVESIVVLIIPDPTTGDPADVLYRGLSLSIEAKLR